MRFGMRVLHTHHAHQCAQMRNVGSRARWWRRWRLSLMPALGRQRQVDLSLEQPALSIAWVPEQPGLYRVYPALKTGKKDKGEKRDLEWLSTFFIFAYLEEPREVLRPHSFACFQIYRPKGDIKVRVFVVPHHWIWLTADGKFSGVGGARLGSVLNHCSLSNPAGQIFT